MEEVMYGRDAARRIIELEEKIKALEAAAANPSWETMLAQPLTETRVRDLLRGLNERLKALEAP